jgi:hypothetical protein
MRRTTWMVAALKKSRHVKALSVDQIKQYLQGGSMGYSKPAELNDFPRPERVLELAEPLELTAEQVAATQALLEAHKTQARGVGARLVDAERELEALFRSGRINSAALSSAVRRLVRVEGEYRLVHLEAHRRMHLLLSEEQIRRYAALRGVAPISGQSAEHP